MVKILLSSNVCPGSNEFSFLPHVKMLRSETRDYLEKANKESMYHSLGVVGGRYLLPLVE